MNKPIYLIILKVFLILLTLVSLGKLFIPNTPLQTELNTGPSVSNISDNRSDYPGETVPQYNKYEISFQIQDTIATNLQLPYDPAPPQGVDLSNPAYNGISVDALFLPPGETDWNKAFQQPAFYYQYFDYQTKPGWDGSPEDWYHPTGDFSWKARFSPNVAGTWQYRISARDARGSTLSSPQTFSVAASGKPGFIKVSSTDRRYFEYSNGSPFYPLGYQSPGGLGGQVASNRSNFQLYGKNGINLDRVWISNIYGTAWLEWLGGRNIYDGYLPRPGTETFHDPVRNRETLTLRIDYEPEGDTDWYDACRFQFWSDPEPVKTNTTYRLQIKYWGQSISGPRIAAQSSFGLVGKIGGDWDVNCYEPGVGNVVTGYGGNTSDWGEITGTWNSGSNHFLPRIYLGLENVTQGKAYIQSISLREDLGNGLLGPEILGDPSLEYDHYFRERKALALDQLIQVAEENNVSLKLVLMDKSDMLYAKLNADGTFVSNGQPDNQDGFYGIGRSVNKTRWLQQAWWRYLQARWGYSTSIHSWELTNEGDPWTTGHYELTDELGKFMHCQVFGVTVPAGDGQKCTFQHPNSHMVTTSFWHSFPAVEFWMNANYPNVDYADLHAYVSTSDIGLPETELEKMQWDSSYYHLGHSLELGSWEIGKPIVRGEAGIDEIGNQVEQSGLASDQNGVWFHNFIWSTLDPGGMAELYWWMENINSQPGPDGQPGLFEVYGYFHQFVDNIPLNNGHYVDVQAALTDANLRVTGQKDLTNNCAHLWIQNTRHTWKNVVDDISNLSGLSGTVTINGFTPNLALNIEWHAFTTKGLPEISHSSVTTDSQGAIVLALPSSPQITDLGIKIGDYPTP